MTSKPDRLNNFIFCAVYQKHAFNLLKCFKLVILLFAFSLHARAQAIKESIGFAIGDNVLAVQTTCYDTCTGSVLYINVHDNENTCLIAAEQVLCETGGRVVNIDNCNERIINFNYNGQCFSFDPNRIFSQDGIKNTMTLLSASYDSLAANEVAAFAYLLLSRFINTSEMLVTLHNNTDSDLSVLSYRNDQLLEKHNGETFVNPALDPDDFFLTTNSYIFERLKELQFNVVFENADLTADDGSMSIYAGKQGIPYVNVEAQHEHVAEQMSMLQALTGVIDDFLNLD